MYLNSLNNFRAIAIIFVVAGHSYEIAGLNFNSIAEVVLSDIITGGTSLFVFISGFLFHHIFYKKYQYRSFIKGKIKNVLIPYLVLSTLPVIYFSLHKTHYWNDFFFPHGSGFYNEYFIPIIKYYWTGEFLIGYWYVPFILITFMLSPLHCWFIKSKPSWQYGLTSVFCIISLLIHRPVFNLSVWQSVVYFTPVYLIGILCSLYKDNIYKKLANKEVVFLVIIIALALIQNYLGHFGNYHKPAFEYGGLDIMFIQKVFLCLFFMIFLHRFELLNNKYLQSVAETSFAIFFLHPIIILWIKKNKSIHHFLAIGHWLAYLLYVTAIIVLCVVIAKIVKKITPEYSRYLIGY
jgi:hypothetical protein